jgi:hypothetical protein
VQTSLEMDYEEMLVDHSSRPERTPADVFHRGTLNQFGERKRLPAGNARASAARMIAAGVTTLGRWRRTLSSLLRYGLLFSVAKCLAGVITYFGFVYARCSIRRGPVSRQHGTGSRLAAVCSVRAIER